LFRLYHHERKTISLRFWFIFCYIYNFFFNWMFLNAVYIYRLYDIDFDFRFHFLLKLLKHYWWSFTIHSITTMIIVIIIIINCLFILSFIVDPFILRKRKCFCSCFFHQLRMISLSPGYNYIIISISMFSLLLTSTCVNECKWSI